ncbi:O-methyltransferase [Ignavigranum ruoffiae]|uniref:O-methyltransferase n=1 Tax=Ignavigranum ruoffiae TaxID=89093 RepID=UPI00205ADAD3|nr:O-methyltransferase [Ignavigranum ruoffiae]UPQ86553.1 O-methyltransferase [Ignavigranum ruoffiae]
MQNEMMYRPIVNQQVLDFMRTRQGEFPGALGNLEAEAHQAGVPIIPHETAKYIDLLCMIYQPQQILEIGTAVGFSASLLAQHIGAEGLVTTIDRYDLMAKKAKENFDKLGLTDKIKLIEGDAVDILPTLSGPYDLIFMDSAKAKYVEFLPECLRLLKRGGLLLIDDVFQAGTVFDAEEQIPKRVRKIHRKLNELLDVVEANPALRESYLPLGDGLLIVRKENN